MKIILSRKGFDSANGGTASPVMPDGTLLSLPIPGGDHCEKFNVLFYKGQSYSEIWNSLKSVFNKMAGIDVLSESDPQIENAKDLLWRAGKINDEQLKALTVASAINNATSSKWIFINTYVMNCKKSTNPCHVKETAKRAENAIRALAMLTECVRIEYNGYALMGEDEACYECLSKYATFLFENKLYDRDTAFWLFSNLPVKKSEPLLYEDLMRAVCGYCNCFE